MTIGTFYPDFFLVEVFSMFQLSIACHVDDLLYHEIETSIDDIAKIAKYRIVF